MALELLSAQLLVLLGREEMEEEGHRRLPGRQEGVKGPIVPSGAGIANHKLEKWGMGKDRRLG